MSTPGAGVTSRAITRNTVWNLAGVAAPIPAALVAIPVLLRVMGQDRFGLLTIAWTLMGYFGLFDLGLARAMTKYVLIWLLGLSCPKPKLSLLFVI